jgi:hypothetical protein
MFEKVTYSHLPRTHPKIKIADKLVNKELDRVNDVWPIKNEK